jgi:5'(3')-deoxyribonucleotidase
MKIGIDLDNTALEFQWHWVGHYQRWFDVAIDPLQLKSWDAITSATHFKDDGEFFRWAGVARIWRDMPWRRGAEGFIDECLRLGHQVVFLTARSDAAAVEQTQQWYNALPFANPRYYRFPAELRTNQVRKSHNKCGLFIDDAPHVLEELRDAGCNVVAMDQPWNTEVRDVHRVSRWTEMQVTAGDVTVRSADLPVTTTKVKAA